MAKSKQCILISSFFLTVSLQASSLASTNLTSSVGESWATVSNRWGGVAMSEVKLAAEHEDLSAQYYLGIKYMGGDKIPQNKGEAFNWMQLAAKQGMARAQTKLGFMYENGWGGETNFSEAVACYDKAAQQGDLSAQCTLGWIYEEGVKVPQNYAAAAKLYQRAAAQGDSWSQNKIGWFLKNGMGMPQDQQTAAKWFQKAAEGGNQLGAENLAWMYFYANGIERNFRQAEYWMQRAVNTNSPDGQYKVGNFIASEAGDQQNEVVSHYLVAAEWLRKAAETGHIKAELELAELYHFGNLGNNQRSNCIPWFLKAAAAGDAEAQARVATLPQFYPNNELLKSVNPLNALRQAAEQGDLSAQFDLARRYHLGDGVPKDTKEAFRWMTKAAEHEVSPITLTIDAHYYLGVMYENGEGVTKDIAKAYQLYQEAAVGGNKPEPQLRLGQMYEKGEGVPKDDAKAAENYYIATQFGFFPTSDDTARGIAIESLLNLYTQGRGMPDDRAVIIKQLDTIKQTPVRTARGQYFLGVIYYQSKVVPQDLAESAAWFRLAGNQKLKDAQEKLAKVETEMTLAQKAAAEERFNNLYRRLEQVNRSYSQLENFRRSKSW